jgi:hypothetical protein
MNISVVICSHNPRQDYLQRTLESLQRQSLSVEDWELLVVDNASEQPLAGRWNLSWHSHARNLREEKLGLTPARLRGIKEANGELLVFVDDDNVLAPDYLQVSWDIARRMPWLGAFNGSTIGEYEEPLPREAKDLEVQLANREIKCASWACLPGTRALGVAPCGAGMVIRRSVALHYRQLASRDHLRLALDRSGKSLSSAGDSDMALCSCDLGLAVGVFPELKLTHLIPKRRVQKDYLLQLAEGMECSHSMLRFLRDGELPSMPGHKADCRSDKMLQIYKRWRQRFRRLDAGQVFRAKLAAANARGRAKAIKILENAKQLKSVS